MPLKTVDAKEALDVAVKALKNECRKLLKESESKEEPLSHAHSLALQGHIRTLVVVANTQLEADQKELSRMTDEELEAMLAADPEAQPKKKARVR